MLMLNECASPSPSQASFLVPEMRRQEDKKTIVEQQKWDQKKALCSPIEQRC